MYNENMNVSIDVDAKPVKAKKEKKKKPIWLKIVIWFVSIIFSLLALLGGVVAFIYFKFNINVFKLFGPGRPGRRSPPRAVKFSPRLPPPLPFPAGNLSERS